ncbi:MAG TPA: vitamin K epoxide reductase family protein [Candidatus Saccharibacteria bacterium]|nr:vitamin K epoxide reductase family protein [Candidatus Saccharibacteria bacterium]
MWLSKLFDNNRNKQAETWVFGIMLAAGLLALLSSFVLTVEKFHLLENPGTVLACDINAFISCSTVMQTWQASVFGFPNTIIGLMADAVVVTIAVLGLARVKLPRFILILANVGFLLGAIFAYWLLFQSVYVIEVLCPWCLVVTFTTTLIFATMTHYNLMNNTFGLKKRFKKLAEAFTAKGYHQMVVASWIVIIVALVYIKFSF